MSTKTTSSGGRCTTTSTTSVRRTVARAFLATGWSWAGCAALVVAATLCGCSAPAPRSFSPGDYHLTRCEWTDAPGQGTHLTTDHFEIYTTVEDPEFNEYLPRFLETTHRFYASLLPLPRGGEGEFPRMRTYVLADRAQWDRFVRARFPNRYRTYRMITAGGFSEGGACVVYDIGRAATLSVLAHEGFHQYAANYFDEPLPAWLNEGLATYCETVEFRDDRPYFTPQRNTFRINHLCNALTLESTLSLNDLLATNAGAVIEGNQVQATATYYAQAWALVVYLLHEAGPGAADGFRRMLGDVADGTLRIQAQAAKATAPSPGDTSFGEAVFYAYFTNDLAPFERDYHAFLKKRCW